MNKQLVFVFFWVFILSFHDAECRKIVKRQATRCTFRGRSYSENDQWNFETRNKAFACTCGAFGLPDCTWQAKEIQRRRCYDRRSRIHHDEGSNWERQIGNKTLDCLCKRSTSHRRMLISCSGENRCHYNGVSYVTGDDWKLTEVTGLVLDCQCHGGERVTCRGSVTKDTPKPEADAQWVEDHIVYGKEVLRPRITTLQACDTGDRVVTSGYTWNQTTQVRSRDFTVERCECRDALIQCEPYHVSRSPEPHCLTDDGRMKRIGEEWIKVHHTHKNIRWRCFCRAHGQKHCHDIGYCQDPSPPPNGAMVCVAAGDAGPDQSLYCKPMCLQGYDFLNRQRYYRIWEVCSRITHHRWSGGYADDALLLAKCRRPENAVRGRPSLYLPTDDCDNLTTDQINQIKIDFIRSLHRNHLCDNKCETKWFRCGRMVEL